MGLLICAIFVALLTIWGNLGSEDYKLNEKAVRSMIAGVFTTFLVYGLVVAVFHFETYHDYAKARAQYDSVLSQYGQAITIYENKAVIDVKKVGDTWTDFRFQGYQENMAKMITELRNNVADYNSYLIKRQIWGKNYFVGCYMVMPDKDMKTIDIINTVPAQK